MAECAGIKEHEKLLAEYGIQIEHLEEKVDDLTKKIDRLHWLLVVTLGGVVTQLAMQMLGK